MAQDSLIVTSSDFATYKDIGANIDSTNRLEPYIYQAQRLDLIPVLGAAFYHDIITNGVNVSPIPSPYDTLIDGGTYTNSQSNTIYFEGLKPVLIYFAYSRFLINDNIHSTRKGFVFKDSEQSERIPQGQLKALSDEAKSTAIAYQNALIDFLVEETATYPLWESAIDYKPKKISKKIFSVRSGDTYPSGRAVNNATDINY